MVTHPNRNRKASIAAMPSHDHDHDVDYGALLDIIRLYNSTITGRPLFTTDAKGLFDIFLRHVGAERSIHTCTACRSFVDHFGGLVCVEEEGWLYSPIWPSPVPVFYRPAIRAMTQRVLKARVTGVFLSSEKTWGLPKTGIWTHFSVKPATVYQARLLTAGQAMAAKREDFGTVARALADFTQPMIAEALRLFQAEHLARSERFIAPLRWLADLHTKRAAAKDARVRDNLLWLAVATAPEGFCHPRASVVGSLLEDIAAGMPFADVKARFDAKMHPLHYQRPQSAPTAGNVATAEKIVEKLGIAPALERRFARLDEVVTVWRPRHRPAYGPTGTGVFAHLSPKDSAATLRSMPAPAAVVTWEKFSRVVLPTAESIDIRITSGKMNFTGMLTAQDPYAPVIMKWGNPFSCYVYSYGSEAFQWGLSPGWASVTAVVPRPNLWGANPQPHLGDGVILAISGCVDSKHDQGNCLFPETLIADLHGARATIEAYSRGATIHGHAEASVCGLGVSKGTTNIGYRLRVTSNGRQTEYTLDRWD